MNPQNLAEMANNIADFFEAEPDHEVAVEGIANHIRKFWEQRMRRQILAYNAAGGETLHPLVKEALARLAAPVQA
jgi:formate dehydrogenase subunit delta